MFEKADDLTGHIKEYINNCINAVKLRGVRDGSSFYCCCNSFDSVPTSCRLYKYCAGFCFR